MRDASWWSRAARSPCSRRNPCRSRCAPCSTRAAPGAGRHDPGARSTSCRGRGEPLSSRPQHARRRRGGQAGRASLTRAARSTGATSSSLRPATDWLDARRRIPFCSTYDVEIAQAALVFDPVHVGDLLTACAWACAACRSRAGWSLNVVLLRSDLVGKTPSARSRSGPEQHRVEAATFIDGPGTIQTPEVPVRGLAFDTR